MLFVQKKSWHIILCDKMNEKENKSPSAGLLLFLVFYTSHYFSMRILTTKLFQN